MLRDVLPLIGDICDVLTFLTFVTVLKRDNQFAADAERCFDAHVQLEG